MLNVVVTGGSRGIGLGIARRLAASGYGVIAVARHASEPLMAALHEHEPAGAGRLLFRPCDLANTANLHGLVKQLRAEFGHIYGLVNNAGIGSSGLLSMMPDRQIGQLVLMNTIAPVILTKYVIRGMMADGGGRIVNIASIVGFTGYRGLTVYSATKAALIGFTRSLAREVGALGVTVNAVAPGFVNTDLTAALSGQQRGQIARRSALGRLAEISDIAHAVEFLLSEKARNITGTVMTVDAGNTA